MRVKSEWHIQKAKPYFSKKYEQLLKYGLHLDAVTSRWAREYANEVGALNVTKTAIYAIYRSFYLLFIKFLTN